MANNCGNQRLDSLDRIQRDLEQEVEAEKKKKRKPFVVEKLIALADLYSERNALYGDNYKLFGKIMVQLFQGEGVTLSSEADFNRFGILVQIVAKVSRYTQQFKKGGHPDSLDDTAVYSMMLRELDHELREKKNEVC